MLAAAVGMSGAACAPSVAQRPAVAAGATAAGASRERVIDHLTPARDSIGRAPSRFSWTPIEGADGYSLGVWNEVDQMVWRQDHIPTPFVDRPEDVALEPGTYFWSISALQGDEQVAESGLAAFVVRTTP